MKPVSGISLTGTSINFDAQALHDAEEAEYQQEEHDRQNEVSQGLGGKPHRKIISRVKTITLYSVTRRVRHTELLKFRNMLQ